jgi:hypothetical protein
MAGRVAIVDPGERHGSPRGLLALQEDLQRQGAPPSPSGGLPNEFVAVAANGAYEVSTFATSPLSGATLTFRATLHTFDGQDLPCVVHAPREFKKGTTTDNVAITCAP